MRVQSQSLAAEQKHPGKSGRRSGASLKGVKRSLFTYLEFRYDLCAGSAVDKRDVPQSGKGVLVERIEDLCMDEGNPTELGPAGSKVRHKANSK